tara:strand:- start:243 stop:566 length:324 start_codon:yes stop_codon:yes gene_type:complete
MNYTRCTGTRLAIEYNENYLYNAKLACYCPYCCLTTKREPTPYKIIKTEDGFIEIFDESYFEIKDKKYEEIPSSDNPYDPWGSNHCNPNEVHTYTLENDNENDNEDY